MAENPNDSSLCPEGRQLARPIRWGFMKNPESPSAAVQYAVEVESKSGHFLTFYGALNIEPPPGGEVSAKQITERSLRAWGWVGDDWGNVRLTRSAYIVVRHESWQGGRVRAKIISVSESVIDRHALPEEELASVVDVLNASQKQAPARAPTRDPEPSSSSTKAERKKNQEGAPK